MALLLFVFVFNRFAGVFGGFQKDLASVTTQTVKQDLAGIPTYPNSSLELIQTQVLTAGMRTMERTMGRKRGEIFKGFGVYITKDPPSKVKSFYEAKLKGAGWTKVSGSDYQLTFRKGAEYLTVELAEEEAGQTDITITRGTKEIEDFRSVE